ncbi:hypothetical protein C5E05_19130 [Pseudoclavibacter sp. AY1H1]|nr:hypothetical protein C5E05_19130 [Pseudoclavibacter sp. AY1H1]
MFLNQLESQLHFRYQLGIAVCGAVTEVLQVGAEFGSDGLEKDQSVSSSGHLQCRAGGEGFTEVAAVFRPQVPVRLGCADHHRETGGELELQAVFLIGLNSDGWCECGHAQADVVTERLQAAKWLVGLGGKAWLGHRVSLIWVRPVERGRGCAWRALSR